MEAMNSASCVGMGTCGMLLVPFLQQIAVAQLDRWRVWVTG
jgi:cell division inhibitor SulA